MPTGAAPPFISIIIRRRGGGFAVNEYTVCVVFGVRRGRIKGRIRLDWDVFNFDMFYIVILHLDIRNVILNDQNRTQVSWVYGVGLGSD